MPIAQLLPLWCQCKSGPHNLSHFTSWQGNVAELFLAYWKGYHPLGELPGHERDGPFCFIIHQSLQDWRESVNKIIIVSITARELSHLISKTFIKLSHFRAASSTPLIHFEFSLKSVS